MTPTKIIVLDDDPTGSQTVHGCLLLTRWDELSLREAIADASPNNPDIDYYVCQVCGYTAEGEAPDQCPVCKSNKKMFKKIE